MARSVPSMASTASTARSLTATLWPTSRRPISRARSQPKAMSASSPAVGGRRVRTPGRTSNSGQRVRADSNCRPSAANSSMTDSKSVSSRLSRRRPKYHQRMVRRSGSSDRIFHGLCMRSALGTLPAMTTCSTPSRLNSRIMRAEAERPRPVEAVDERPQLGGRRCRRGRRTPPAGRGAGLLGERDREAAAAGQQSDRRTVDVTGRVLRPSSSSEPEA